MSCAVRCMWMNALNNSTLASLIADKLKLSNAAKDVFDCCQFFILLKEIIRPARCWDAIELGLSLICSRSVGLFMSYINTQATSSYKEALQAIEAIEAPSLGFCKPTDYKGALSRTIATIKQANTQIQLLVTILEKIESLEDRIKKIEAKANPEVSLPDEVIQELSNKIKGLNLKEKVKEGRGKLLIKFEITGVINEEDIMLKELYKESPEELQGRRDDIHHRVYMHRSEEAILVTTNQVDRAFIQEESFHQLQRSGMRFIHMGIIQVRIQILHRQEEGTLLLVVFRDNRWQGDQAIFATMEIDLTHGSQLVYVIPDTMLTISDFYRNIHIYILSSGYEGWRNGEVNILITRGLAGRLSNTPNVGFAYEVQNVVDYLASHGVRALPRRRYNTRELMGQNWIITPSTLTVPLQPTEVTTNNLIDGRISLHFNNYQAARTPTPPRYNSRDNEENDEQEQVYRVAVLTLDEEEEEVFYIKKISSTTKTLRRASKGAAGYDLAIDQDYIIPSQGQELLSTRISIKTPEGTYARIAPRSSYAMKGIIIGAGVIDSDYRGLDGWRSQTLLLDLALRAMDSCGEGSSNTSPDRGSLTTDQGQTQFDGIPTPSGPYDLLQQYEELACYTKRTSIYNQEEHDKRSHMADIEWIAIKHILSSIRELVLICQLKESDFRKRSHFQGRDTYWQKALPAVNEARVELFKAFIHMQRTAQLIRKISP
ncbi:hypothetical protein ZIOFF_018766 [Zingiber officinale]|uniref:dUTP diphosphatase n=1 Tax=Zingiber officinale TaxID=94328 RepID=A0A8J5LIX9_ZINOF|nr:hypothetical protein ZIOFF_018766 [Zingiber officinale]